MQRNPVSVAVPARLHLGFLDLHGGLGRRFGSLGITLDGPRTRLRLSPAETLQVRGPEADRVGRHVRTLASHFDFVPDFDLLVEQAIPAHSGLGSGTQLALAVGIAVCRHLALPVSARDLAQVLDRGARSGIGLGAFERGGVLLDGGRGAGDAPPPIICRLPFPEAWRILLIHDRVRGGVHGADEVAAFETLPPFPSDLAAHLSRLMLMRALPGLVESDLAAFGGAVGELQRTTGDHFAPAQGGRYASPAVSAALSWLEDQGLAGIGQSSWGPTGFAIIESEPVASRLLRDAEARWPRGGDLGFEIVCGRNHGALSQSGEPVIGDRMTDTLVRKG